jgi:hypothetical protein
MSLGSCFTARRWTTTTVFSSISTPLERGHFGPDAMMMFFASCTSSPTDFAGGDRSQPLIQSILLRSRFDTFGVGRDDVVFVRQHLFQSTDWVFYKVWRRNYVRLRAACGTRCSNAADGMQPTFRRVPPRYPPLNHSRFQAQLRATGGANVAAGAGTDDDDVVAGRDIPLSGASQGRTDRVHKLYTGDSRDLDQS